MKKETIYLLFPLLALCGCSGDSEALLSEERGEPVVLNSSIGDIDADVTRAPIEATHKTALAVAFGRIDQNTSTGGWPAWTTVSTKLAATRAATEGTAAITFNSGSEQYYPTATSYNAIKYVGWYPANAVTTGKVTFDIDGKTDVMWTTAQQGNATKGDGTADKFSSSSKVFAFAHKLSRITVKAYGDAQASTLWGTITSVKVLNTPTTYTMTLADTPTAAFGSVTDTITLKNTANDADMSAGVLLTNTTTTTAATCGYAMVAPAASYELEVTTTKGGTRKVKVTNTFTASNQYTVYLNFTSTKIEPFATIGAWGTGAGSPIGDFPNNE